MGKPAGSNVPASPHEKIVWKKLTQGSETSQYLEERKSKRDSQSSGERNGKSPNHVVSTMWGCRAAGRDSGVGRRSRLESRAGASESLVSETEKDTGGT